MASLRVKRPTESDVKLPVERSMHERLSPSLRGRFWPDAIFQVTVLVAILFVVMIVLSIAIPAPIGAPADPMNKEGYIPRPAWYFYSLFILLEIFKGPVLVLVGTIGLPTLLILAMVLLPFYDRNPSRKPRNRPVAMGVGYGIMAIVVAFTTYGIATAPAQGNQQASAPGGAVAHPTFAANIQPLFQSSGCYTCHSTSGGNQGGLNLQTAAGAIKGGIFGAAVIPGNPNGSLMVQVLESPNNPAGAQMPLGGKPLSADAIQTVKNWIADGAK